MSVSLVKSTDAPTTLPGLSDADALQSLTAADAARFRFVVTPDPDADGPLQWGHLVSVDLVRAYGGHLGNRLEVGGDPIGLADAASRLSDGVTPQPGHWADADATAERAIRWARVFLGVEVRRVRLSGLSQSDWSDVLVYLASDGERAAAADDQAQALDGWIGDLEAWYRGEVYGLRLERETEDGDWITAPDCDVWGFYLEQYGSRRYTAADAAVDSFGVPRDFAEGVPVVDADVTW